MTLPMTSTMTLTMILPKILPSRSRYGRRALSALPLMLVAAIGLGQTPPASPQRPPGSELPTDQPVTVILEGARPRQRLALPATDRPAALSRAALAAAVELEKTLREDLELTGIFDIQGPEVLSALRLPGQRDRDFEVYRSVGNQVILLNELRLEGDRLVLASRMYDLASKGMILGKRYRGEFDLTRRIAHSLNDEIVLFFTGRRGIALTALAFTSDRDQAGNKELYLMDYDGFDQRRVTGHESLTFSPSWAPDGSGIAYVSYFERGPSLYWADIESGKKRGVVVDGTLSISPSVSPDGSRIAFARSLEGNTEIYVVGLNGKGLTRLTNSSGIDVNPAWSPTGDSIAFTSSRSGSPQIYLMKADGSAVRRLTFEGRYNDGADWHPDGSKVAFAARTEDGNRFDIAVVDLVTSQRIILTTGPGSHEAPSFSPDGRLIAYESSRAGGRQIFLMTADGRQLRQLSSGGSNYGPSWSNFLK